MNNAITKILDRALGIEASPENMAKKPRSQESQPPESGETPGAEPTAQKPKPKPHIDCPYPPDGLFASAARACGLVMPAALAKSVMMDDAEWQECLDVIISHTPAQSLERFRAQSDSLHTRPAQEIAASTHRSREAIETEDKAIMMAAKKRQHVIEHKAQEMLRPLAEKVVSAFTELAHKIETDQRDLCSRFSVPYKGDSVSLYLRKACEVIEERMRQDPRGVRPASLLAGIPIPAE